MRKLVLFSFLFFYLPAFADLELRVLSSNISGNVDSFNNALDGTVTNTPNLNGTQKVTGWDARYIFPIIPLSIGYRSESWKSEGSGSGTYQSSAAEMATKFEGSRNSVLAGYRMFSNPLFGIGLLAHYGLDSKMEFQRDTTVGSTTRTNIYKGKMDPSYGLAFEGSVYLWKLTVGAELGYTVLKAASITDDSTYIPTSMSGLSWDFSGTYMMLSAGLSF